jgi:putative tributyrin esterase
MALINLGFPSRVIGKKMNINVILPDENRWPANGENLKTVLLLHGWSGDHTDWVRETGIERYANARQIAVVMPDAANSFYADMAYGPAYFTHITEELPAICRKYFPLSDRREDNFVIGLSMGGYGALKIGLAKPEQYAGIGCLSAGNIPEGFREQAKNPRPGWLRTMNIIYGDLFPDQMMGSVHDAYRLAEEILRQGKPAPRIYHLWGDRDIAEKGALLTKDYFLGLAGNPFEYTWKVYPGGHDWELWDAHIEECLDYLGLKPQ